MSERRAWGGAGEVSLVTGDLALTVLVHGHQVAAGFEMDAQLKEDELS